jgi:hypothetical protein
MLTLLCGLRQLAKGGLSDELNQIGMACQTTSLPSTKHPPLPNP